MNNSENVALITTSRSGSMMNNYQYPTAFSLWGEEEAAAIARVQASGRWTMGPETEAFEAEFAAYHGVKHCVMVNSGSSANLIAVAALFHLKDNPLKRGDKAIVPAIAWSTTYAPLVQYGLDLVLADVDDTWNASPVMYGLGGGIRLVVGCSILGNPAHLAWWQDDCKRLADPNGCYFIEDNCESLGASIGGKLCGTFGLMNTFSFFWSHQLSAIEGGAVLTDDDECARMLKMLRAHGWTRDITKPVAFHEEYNFVLMGYNLRPLEMHAAIAREQLKKLDQFIAVRRQNMAHFRSLAMDAYLPIIPQRVNGITSPFGLQFTVADSATRAVLVAALRQAGIDCRLPTGGSFHLHPYGAKYLGQRTENADRIHRCGLFLGNAPYDISEKIEQAVSVMREVLS